MPWWGTFRERVDDGAVKGWGAGRQRCFLVEYIIIRVYAAAVVVGCCGDDPQVACVDRIPRACAGGVGGCVRVR